MDRDRINRLHDTLLMGARQRDGGPWKTPMQESGAYREIARDLGLDPRTGFRELYIPDDCNCSAPTS